MRLRPLAGLFKPALLEFAFHFWLATQSALDDDDNEQCRFWCTNKRHLGNQYTHTLSNYNGGGYNFPRLARWPNSRHTLTHTLMA